MLRCQLCHRYHRLWEILFWDTGLASPRKHCKENRMIKQTQLHEDCMKKVVKSCQTGAAKALFCREISLWWRVRFLHKVGVRHRRLWRDPFRRVHDQQLLKLKNKWKGKLRGGGERKKLLRVVQTMGKPKRTEGRRRIPSEMLCHLDWFCACPCTSSGCNFHNWKCQKPMWCENRTTRTPKCFVGTLLFRI